MIAGGFARCRFAMKIVCPQCRTAYDVTPAALGSHGRQVRCARCKTMWVAEPPNLAANVIPLSRQDGRVVPPPPSAPAATPAPPAGAPVTSPSDPLGPAPAAEVAIPEAADEATAEASAAVASEPAVEDAVPAEAADAAAAEATPEPGQTTDAAESAPAAADAVDIESAAVRRLPPRRLSKRSARQAWRSQALGAAILVLVAINIGLLLGRTQVVRALPQTASLFESIGLPVNLRDLGFKDIKTTQELHDGVTILVIEGTIVSTGAEAADVPRLRFSIGAANGHEIYAWTALPTRTRLAPGETLPFRTRLASPPEQGRTVQVRFFARHDLASGLR
jgi:predicted Zn finger-like uncharacterized protein